MCSTLRMLFTLSKVKGWASRKVDYLQAFPQAKLRKDENVSMHITEGLHVDSSMSWSEYVLKLNKKVYGLKQASYNWSELLKAGLLQLGFKQSIVDPCLYIKDDILCAICVDDTLLFSPNESKIDKVISKLKKLGLT